MPWDFRNFKIFLEFSCPFFNKYKKKCMCRKPNNKMLKDLLQYWNIKIKDSIMIGDRKTDYIAAKKSNIKFYYINDRNISEIKKNLKKIISN